MTDGQLYAKQIVFAKDINFKHHMDLVKINQLNTCETNKSLDQPAHLCSIIQAFVVLYQYKSS